MVATADTPDLIDTYFEEIKWNLLGFKVTPFRFS